MLLRFVPPFLTSALLLAEPVATAFGQAASPAPIPLREALALRSAGRPGRSAVHTDPIEAQIVSGQWHRPVAGDTVVTALGREQTWQKVVADTNGNLPADAVRGGYVYWAVESPGEQILLLEASGHSVAYVNGEIRAGDPYAYGYVRLPVRLRAGTNDLLFQGMRGALHAQLTPPTAPLLVDTADPTLPDLVCSETEPVWCAAVLINSSTNSLTVSLRCKGARTTENEVTIPPLGTRKAPFLFYPARFKQPTNCPVNVEVVSLTASGKVETRARFTLRVRRPDQTCKRTFRSTLDDSVQYFAVNPPPSGTVATTSPALFLSLHGAGVEAIGQADSYSPKRWGYLVSPTNRRPYGFDWEEWGCWDAFEVLNLAKDRFHVDPQRIYLTGHSMGGHGTWQLGALFPDRFAAIGPSAGWISFTSYVETNRSTATNLVQKMLARSGAASDTLLLATNYLQEGVYILHGDADDNVPVTEARKMREVLGGFHRDFDFFEQPGAGHWWDASDEPGTDCVDWAPMFDFFSHRVIPADEEVRRIRFVTVNPAVSCRDHWVTVLAQERQLEPSFIDVRCDPLKRRLAGTTANIASVSFEPAAIEPGGPVTVELDGQKIENLSFPKSAPSGVAPICLTRRDGRWEVGTRPAAASKNPERSGPFRQAFRNHMAFVYGTQGTPEENAWALAKARYDAEAFWYRGNGSVELISDKAYLEQIADRHPPRQRRNPGQVELRKRNVILYGHAESNGAWPVLLATSPVQVHRGTVRVGGRELNGSDLACLFLQPNPTEDQALVGVVSGSGLPGLRLTERLPYFLAGAGFPDCLVVGSEMLTRGVAGVRAAGFFGQDWSVAHGEFGWNE
jgi:dienelactone hydrolase